MPISMENVLVLGIMVFYGLLSGGSAIILKIGIFRAGGIKIDNFLRDIGPAAWRLIKTPIWMLGAIAAITGFFIYTIALNIYDVSVVKPLVNTNLLFTFIFAYIVFKEHLTRIEWFGVGILVTGLLLSAFSPEIESSNTMNIPLLFAFFPLILIMMVIMIFIMFISKKGHAEFIFPIFAGSFYGMGTFFTKSVLISLNKLNYGNLFPMGMLIYSVLMFLLTYGFAIVAQQLAFERGRLSIVSPITNSLSVIVSFIGAYFVFYEDLIILIGGKLVFHSFFKIIGLICILIALIVLRREIILLDIGENETTSLNG
ncbi:MAG: EamA family transporter [Candidatus Hodarchaeota archaeon]